MKYFSTRGAFRPVGPAEAIVLGLVPDGGLFVPEAIPALPPLDELSGGSYLETAFRVLSPLMSDFTAEELRECISRAYTSESFDIPSVIRLHPLGENDSVMELWHGPTAAFKDVALQIMPHFLAAAKKKLGQPHHTVILVATSGDTGKAALEGFGGCEGISIIVFYPDDGVSEIQKLQMVTTDAANTAVVAVRGNFDDCQNGVKDLFADTALAERLAAAGCVFSSANSINWGRLCPQIVYYVQAYLMLVEKGTITCGEPVDFCVPTGNFGNILAAYYAMRMGLPVGKLLCASNRNRILTDFFATGTYDRNREFYRTISPSMDILISSNLERFLFEVNGRDAGSIRAWCAGLADRGAFSVDSATKRAMDAVITAGWVDEPQVIETIGDISRRHSYVVDTHTAVAVAMNRSAGRDGAHTIIDATASPYKFSGEVVQGICGERIDNEFDSISRLHDLTGLPVHRAVRDLRTKPVRHTRTIDAGEMRDTVLDIVQCLTST